MGGSASGFAIAGPRAPDGPLPSRAVGLSFVGFNACDFRVRLIIHFESPADTATRLRIAPFRRLMQGWESPEPNDLQSGNSLRRVPILWN
jgi:hypothetical protein